MIQDTEVLQTVKKSSIQKLQDSLFKCIIGQRQLIEHLLVALIAGGHVLIEGMPGLAKTTVAKSLANSIDGKFHRIQFTPDLLPSDIVGTDIYMHEQHDFNFKAGPIFQNILLADEINRAPAKVQSALLEAMEEKQVTIGQVSYKLPDLFMVIATQNPIEQEGTYNLPEAQLDRFMLQINVAYPSHDEELQILSLHESKDKYSTPSPMASIEQVKIGQNAAENIYVDPKLKSYIVSLVHATRNPELYDSNLQGSLVYGASPRATIAILKSAKALAWLRGSDYVIPEHIQEVAANALRHRISISFAAQANGLSKDQILENIIRLVAIP